VIFDRDLAAERAARFQLTPRRRDETGVQRRERVARDLHARGEPRPPLEALFNQTVVDHDLGVAQDVVGGSLGDLVIRRVAAASDPTARLAGILRQRVAWRNRLVTVVVLLMAAALAVMAVKPGPYYDLYAASLFGATAALAVMVLVTAVPDMVIGIPAFARENARVARQATGSWARRDHEGPGR
jgi:hypothetical protein